MIPYYVAYDSTGNLKSWFILALCALLTCINTLLARVVCLFITRPIPHPWAISVCIGFLIAITCISSGALFRAVIFDYLRRYIRLENSDAPDEDAKLSFHSFALIPRTVRLMGTWQYVIDVFYTLFGVIPVFAGSVGQAYVTDAPALFKDKTAVIDYILNFRARYDPSKIRKPPQPPISDILAEVDIQYALKSHAKPAQPV